MIVKLLTEQNLEFLSLKGGYTGSSESTNFKMPLCWKSHALAHVSLIFLGPLKAKTEEELVSYLLLWDFWNLISMVTWCIN